MKALTVRQPWAGAMFAAEGWKDVENRTRAFSHRGMLAVHAGLALADQHAFATVAEQLGDAFPVLGTPQAGVAWEMGAIVGVVDVVDGHPDCGGSCSPWALPGNVHHRLANPRVLSRPVPAYGRLGIWTVPGDVEDQVWWALT